MPIIVPTATYLFPLRFYSLKRQRNIPGRKVISFLSFADAFVSLIDHFSLQKETLLVPSLYCQETLTLFRRHFNLVFYAIDPETLDANLEDFTHILESSKPRVVLIYNVLGKETVLHRKTEWGRSLRDDAIVISDMAHSLLPLHPLSVLHPRHFFIDSARKCTPHMVSHLVCPPGITLDKNNIRRIGMYSIRSSFLHLLKQWILRLHRFTHIAWFAHLSEQVFLLHNDVIGTSSIPYMALPWDHELYRHLKCDVIAAKRAALWDAYDDIFRKRTPASARFYDLPLESRRQVCFYFISVSPDRAHALIAYAAGRSVLIDQLWDLRGVEGLSDEERTFGSSIMVLPLNPTMSVQTVRQIANTICDFFDSSVLKQ